MVIIMNEFKRVAASKKSIGQRKRVHGKGINDAWYITNPTDANGKQGRCPYYQNWVGMVERCYSPAAINKRPTYIRCFVCEEWLAFSKFLIWIERQEKIYRLLFGVNIFILELDKDIRIIGNQGYRDAGCCFATGQANRLLCNHRNARGPYPQGVTRNRKSYQAKLSIDGKSKHLGMFATPEEASRVYKKAKKAEIIRVALLQKDIRIRDGLLRHAELFNL